MGTQSSLSIEGVKNNFKDDALVAYESLRPVQQQVSSVYLMFPLQTQPRGSILKIPFPGEIKNKLYKYRVNTKMRLLLTLLLNIYFFKVSYIGSQKESLISTYTVLTLLRSSPILQYLC